MSSDNFKVFIKKVGRRIRAYRNFKGLSQEMFGKPLGKSPNAIKNYERGPKGNRDHKIPLEILYEISIKHEIPIEYLLFGKKFRPPKKKT